MDITTVKIKQEKEITEIIVDDLIEKSIKGYNKNNVVARRMILEKCLSESYSLKKVSGTNLIQIEQAMDIYAEFINNEKLNIN